MLLCFKTHLYVCAGCDKTVKVWRQEGAEWVEEACWRDHADWVRDVAWAPSLGLPSSTIAACTQDGKVTVYSQEQVGGAGTNLSRIALPFTSNTYTHMIRIHACTTAWRCVDPCDRVCEARRCVACVMVHDGERASGIGRE